MNKQLTIGILLGATALAGLFFLFGKDADTRVPQNTEEPAINVVNTPDPVTATTTPNESPAITEDYISDEDDEPNEPVVDVEDWRTSKYTEPLPPEPSAEDAKNNFPDVNNNKVRDDIELLIVEEWADHAMMVETLFTQARTTEYELYAASDNHITEEEILKSNEFLAKDGACRFFYYTNTVGTSDEYFQEKTYQVVSENYYNSLTRLGYMNDFDNALHGSISRSVNMNHEKCQSYFQETRNLGIGG